MKRRSRSSAPVVSSQVRAGRAIYFVHVVLYFLERRTIPRYIISIVCIRLRSGRRGNRTEAETESDCEFPHLTRIVVRQQLYATVRPVSQEGHLTTRNHEAPVVLEPEAKGNPPLLSQPRQGPDDLGQGQRMWVVSGPWISRSIFSIRSNRSLCAVCAVLIDAIISSMELTFVTVSVVTCCKPER